MAHFAKINENNIVEQVIVVANEVLLDENGIEQESIGAQFCAETFGGTWIQTSYNGNIRKNYAGIGFTYDPVADHFFSSKPYPSWTLDADANWQAPTPYPIEGSYIWNEETLSWIEITE